MYVGCVGYLMGVCTLCIYVWYVVYDICVTWGMCVKWGHVSACVLWYVSICVCAVARVVGLLSCVCMCMCVWYGACVCVTMASESPGRELPAVSALTGNTVETIIHKLPLIP